MEWATEIRRPYQICELPSEQQVLSVYRRLGGRNSGRLPSIHDRLQKASTFQTPLINLSGFITEWENLQIVHKFFRRSAIKINRNAFFVLRYVHRIVCAYILYFFVAQWSLYVPPE